MHGGELYTFKVSTADVRKQLAKIGPGIWRLKQVLKLLDAPVIVYEVWAVDGGGETFFLSPQRGEGTITTEVIEIEEIEHVRAMDSEAIPTPIEDETPTASILEPEDGQVR